MLPRADETRHRAQQDKFHKEMVEEGLQQKQGSQHPLEVHGEAVVGSYAPRSDREALARADQ